jgi:cysteine synthase A
MRSSLAFIESNTTGSGMLALERARWLGMRPLLVTSRPDRYRGLAETGAKVITCDTNQPRLITQALRRFRLAGVTTTSEFYLPTAAELAAAFALPGNPPATVRRCRDKAAVREMLNRAGIAQPAYVVATSPAQAADAWRRMGTPCVVKPVDESASTGVRRCDTAEQAASHAACLLSAVVNSRGQAKTAVVLVEQYADGPEYSVELFGTREGLVTVGVTRKEVTGGPWFVETGHRFPAELGTDASAGAVDLARRAVRALGLAVGATHTEIRLTASGPQLIEVNARLAGGMIPELVRLATGVDLVEQQVRAACGMDTGFDATTARYAGIDFLTAPLEGTLRTVVGLAAARALAGVEQVTITARDGGRVRPARDAYDRLGFVIATARSADALQGRLAAAVGRIRIDVFPAE